MWECTGSDHLLQLSGKVVCFASQSTGWVVEGVKGLLLIRQLLANPFLQGYKYKMRAIYAHFPINITTSEGDTVVDIRNFLGEKFTRQVKMLPGVMCKHTGVKDEIMVFGNDLEKVSLSCEEEHPPRPYCLLTCLFPYFFSFSS